MQAIDEAGKELDEAVTNKNIEAVFDFYENGAIDPENTYIWNVKTE
jgi:hypothetical protein